MPLTQTDIKSNLLKEIFTINVKYNIYGSWLKNNNVCNTVCFLVIWISWTQSLKIPSKTVLKISVKYPHPSQYDAFCDVQWREKALC